MTNTIEIRFPEDQQEGTEATVTRWLVAEGDRVAAHDPVVEIETDKVVVEVAAPEAGRITAIRIQQDEAANPGDVLCLLEADGAGEPASETSAGSVDDRAAVAAESKSEPSRLSPAVKKRAAELQIDLGKVTGSGRDGRITLQDIETLAAGVQPTTETPAPPKTGTAAVDTAQAEIVRHDRMRKRIADNMVASLLRTAPHVTAVFEADLSAVLRHREANREAFARGGSPLTLTVYFIAAAIAAIRKVPQVNSQWHDDHLEIFRHINIGIGTALGDQGLIVPVLKQVQDMDLRAIAAGLADLTARARDNRLKPDDVRDGTFTISNHGVSGSLIATPIIINQPQSAILGVGKIEKRIKIMEIDGQDVITIRPMCYVTLTIDHRVLDGYQTNAFLTKLVSTLERWS
jgi:2-oxoglutarate dehydrogenase E2 component (dihydrolipoamide succinyltransferase)